MKTKELVRPMPAAWFLHNRHLLKFMIRELTSFFVLAFAIFLLILLYEANRGGEEFRKFYVGVCKAAGSKHFYGLLLRSLRFTASRLSMPPQRSWRRAGERTRLTPASSSALITGFG